jgi:predicted PurR-regulated permease PerM
VREFFKSRGARLALFVAGMVLVVLALRALAGPLTPFAAALALAYFLNPAVTAMEASFARRAWLSRRVRPRTLAVGLLTFTVLAVVVLSLLFVVPAGYHQVADAVGKAPDYWRVLRARIEPLYQRLNLKYPEQTEEARQRLAEAFRSQAPQVVGPVTRFVSSMFSSLLGFVLTILNLLVIPVFTAYLLFDMNRIQAAIRDLVPHRLRGYVYSRFGAVDKLLSAFVRGQITVALILGVFYAIALTLCGVPMGLFVGFCIGFFNLIPFMSYVLGLPLALTLSWVDDQSLSRLAVVAALFTFGQFVEGNFVSPRIVGDSLGLHAVVIMLAVLVGGSLFGFVGMFLAVPMTASLSVFWADLRGAYLRSDFYGRGVPPPEPPDVGHS